MLLREVAAVEHPFVRGSTCWEDMIAATSQKYVSAKFAKVSARTLRERANHLMEAFLNADTRQRKQSGTIEELKESSYYLNLFVTYFRKERCQSKLLKKEKELRQIREGRKL